MNKSIGGFLLFISTALYLLATGVLGLTEKSLFKNFTRDGGGEIRRAVSALFKGNLAETLIIILAVLAIAAGAFLLLKFFGIDIPVTELLLIILAIVWVVFIIMIDVVYPLNNKGANFIDWLRSIGSHLMVLGALLLATERFGG